MLAQGYVEGVPQPNPPSASMFVNVICRSTTTTTSTTSTTSSTTSTSTAGTAPCTTIDTNKDECTGTPTDGSLTASANIVSVTNVSITGTSATGSVTIDITDYAGNAWSYTGGATDGAAQVCITPSHGATTMDYYLPPSGPWTHAAPLSFPGDSICGVMPVSALSGTTIAVGVASTATAPCASTAPDEDECTGTPVGGNLTATSTDTGVNVSITGTSATGRVTINTTDYGGTPPSSGADLSLGSGAGATDGAAQVCITPSHGATTMDYYLPPSGPWTHAAPLSFPGGSICGVMPVSALSGTPVAVGTTSTTTTSSSTTTSTTTTSSTITSSSTTASTSTTAVAPGVPEFPLALGIGVALALALPALLLVKARLRKP
ncbi:MAG: hypothetical protein ABSB53_08570 [Nitrososphaerales archaeon]